MIAKKAYNWRALVNIVSTAFLYPIYHSQYLVRVHGIIYSLCNVTCSEANPAIHDLRVPSVLVAPSAPSAPACQSEHPTTEVTVCNVRCHDQDATTSNCAATAYSVHGGSYDPSISELFNAVYGLTQSPCAWNKHLAKK